MEGREVFLIFNFCFRLFAFFVLAVSSRSMDGRNGGRQAELMGAWGFIMLLLKRFELVGWLGIGWGGMMGDFDMGNAECKWEDFEKNKNFLLLRDVWSFFTNPFSVPT